MPSHPGDNLCVIGKRSRRRGAEQRRGEGAGARAPYIHSADERILAKVRGLLAKAESTPFEAEAEALTAKAQELMARYALSEAMLGAEGSRSGDPETLEVGLSPPYVDAKAHLLGAVASANRCRVVWSSEPPRAVVFGFASDLQAVELLFTSLLLQATHAALAMGSVRDVTGTSRTRSFRRSFLLGFATRIGERLRETTATVTDEVETTAGLSLVPILRDRSARVDEAVRAAFPETTAHRVRVGNGGGFVAGRAAGDRAIISDRPIVPSRRSALASNRS